MHARVVAAWGNKRKSVRDRIISVKYAGFTRTASRLRDDESVKRLRRRASCRHLQCQYQALSDSESITRPCARNTVRVQLATYRIGDRKMSR